MSVTAASEVSARGAAWPTPAAWMTPVSGRSAGMAARTAASWSRSAASQAARVTRAPKSSSSARSSAAPGASGPRRLVRTRCRAPLRASQRATSAPRPPVPPVTSTVPSAVKSSAWGSSWTVWPTSRRPSVPVARMAIWSSPACAARALTSCWVAGASRTGGRSISPLHGWGCSSAAIRPRPHAAAWTGWVSGSAGPVETAPRVRVHTGADRPVSASAWVRTTLRARPVGSSVPSGPGRSASGSRDRTPETFPTASRRVVSSTRSRQDASRTSRSNWAPCPRRASRISSASMSSVVTASQVPSSTGAALARTGFHSTR